MKKSSGDFMRYFFFLLLILVSSAVQAVSVSLLKGSGYRKDLGYRSTKETVTIENFAMWEYGSVFFYYDITEPRGRDQGTQYYSNQFFGGISPTFSLSKILGKQVGYGFIKDVSIRTELENGSGNGAYNFQNYFYGLQYDLAVPGFDFVSMNTVVRDNPRVHGVGFQIGVFWQATHEWGPKSRFKFTGFFATSPWNGNNNRKRGGPATDNLGRFFTGQPQLLYDIGHAFTGKPNRVETGIEYAYFLNRFQQYKKDEKVVQYIVKFTF
jgi:nucleoside-specific outer membrane channel protein Tsx